MPKLDADQSFSCLDGLLHAAGALLLNAEQEVIASMTAPGIKVSVSAGNEAVISFVFDADHLAEENDEERVRTFLADLIQAL